LKHLTLKPLNTVGCDPDPVLFEHLPKWLTLSILTGVESISEIDHQISHCRRFLLSSHHSSPLHYSHLRSLASLYNSCCFKQHQPEKEDIDMSILYSAEAVFATSHSDRANQDTVEAFYFLAIWYRNCLLQFKQPSDTKYCIEYFCYLKSLPLEEFGLPSDNPRVCLLEALAIQALQGMH